MGEQRTTDVSVHWGRTKISMRELDGQSNTQWLHSRLPSLYSKTVSGEIKKYKATTEAPRTTRVGVEQIETILDAFFSLMQMRWNTDGVGSGNETGSTWPVDDKRIVGHDTI